MYLIALVEVQDLPTKLDVAANCLQHGQRIDRPTYRGETANASRRREAQAYGFRSARPRSGVLTHTS